MSRLRTPPPGFGTPEEMAFITTNALPHQNVMCRCFCEDGGNVGLCSDYCDIVDGPQVDTRMMMVVAVLQV